MAGSERPKIPNGETQAAMEEARAGKTLRFTSFDEMMAELEGRVGPMSPTPAEDTPARK